MAGFNRRDFLISSGAAIASTGLSSLAFARNEGAAPRRGGTLDVLINAEPPVLVPIFRARRKLESDRRAAAYDFDLKPMPRWPAVHVGRCRGLHRTAEVHSSAPLRVVDARREYRL
ncbi:hypothetical protein QCE47_15210 [Caballeronia sp. LZ025]|uniref:hypothetical protein n=1 Tax=Caballeronia TaxID=1827195 RepID=UPI001FD1F821|nr:MULTISPECIES: hypothetical protein [Caballeronia]MDR5733681.1 hypothetical protein [Caballeronia sp. LZ025]